MDSTSEMYEKTMIQESAGSRGSVWLYIRKTIDEEEVVPSEMIVKKTKATYHHRYLYEHLLLMDLHYSGIPSSYGLRVNEKECFLHLQFCPGINLIKVLNQGKIYDEFIFTIVHQIALILEYIHGKGIVHRDVKLENIIYDSQREKAYLIDWEFARKMGDISKEYPGTIYYFSPDMAHQAYQGPANDMWALGICVYIMAARRFPFHIKSVQEGIQILKNWERLDYQGLPPSIVALLDLLLIEREKRITASQLVRWFEH